MTNFSEHLHAPHPRPHRLSYVGAISAESTADYRIRALRRLGQQVRIFELAPYLGGPAIVRTLRFRYPAGPLIARINRDLVRHVHETQPEIVLLDKPIHFTPQTIDAIQKMKARVVLYMQDNPFGPRNDGCWRQFRRIYKLADLYCPIRQADVRRCEEWGLPHVPVMFSYEPSIHFAPPDGWSDADRDREISYIGHPHEDRAKFLLELAENCKLPVTISGNGWAGVLTEEQKRSFFRGGFLLGTAYREAIWRSKINLSFVTRLNEDDIAHKSIEIAASGGFLLALRTPGHQACFEEDREAVFFSTVEECAEKAAYYLAHPEERETIARRGHARAIASGYSNDTQLAKILNYWG